MASGWGNALPCQRGRFRFSAFSRTDDVGASRGRRVRDFFPPPARREEFFARTCWVAPPRRKDAGGGIKPCFPRRNRFLENKLDLLKSRPAYLPCPAAIPHSARLRFRIPPGYDSAFRPAAGQSPECPEIRPPPTRTIRSSRARAARRSSHTFH
jgi:hypothetical protein